MYKIIIQDMTTNLEVPVTIENLDCSSLEMVARLATRSFKNAEFVKFLKFLKENGYNDNDLPEIAYACGLTRDFLLADDAVARIKKMYEQFQTNNSSSKISCSV